MITDLDTFRSVIWARPFSFMETTEGLQVGMEVNDIDVLPYGAQVKVVRGTFEREYVTGTSYYETATEERLAHAVDPDSTPVQTVSPVGETFRIKRFMIWKGEENVADPSKVVGRLSPLVGRPYTLRPQEGVPYSLRISSLPDGE